MLDSQGCDPLALGRILAGYAQLFCTLTEILISEDSIFYYFFSKKFLILLMVKSNNVSYLDYSNF